MTPEHEEKNLDTVTPPDDDAQAPATAEGEAAITEGEASAVAQGEAPAAAEGQAPQPPTGRGRLKRRLLQIAVLGGFLLLVLVGLMVLFYPQISNYVNGKNQSRVIDAYSQSIIDLSPEDYTAAIAAAEAYNARLAGSGATVSDAFVVGEEDTERTSDYWKILDVAGDGVMGYVEIEELNIKLPLYHGVSEVVLARGVGHIQGSSMPVGGESTHAVVSAHTGLPSAKLFTGVDTMKTGDTFTLYILNEVLTYQVDQILVVLPHEIDALGIEKGSDYITLVTCTPYGINSHRLLIRGTRIETPLDKLGIVSTQNAVEQAQEAEEPGWFRRAIDGVVVFLAGIIEGGAEVIVGITEWGMDIFGVEY